MAIAGLTALTFLGGWVFLFDVHLLKPLIFGVKMFIYSSIWARLRFRDIIDQLDSAERYFCLYP